MAEYKDPKFEKRLRSAILIVVSVLTMGTLVYHYLEKWTWIDSIYFSTVTLTTVGYGDLYPTTPLAKLFTVAYVLSGVSIMLYTLSIIASHYVEFHQPLVEKRFKETLNRIPIPKKVPDRWITLRIKDKPKP